MSPPATGRGPTPQTEAEFGLGATHSAGFGAGFVLAGWAELRIKQALTLKADGFTLNLARCTSAERHLPIAVENSAPVGEDRPAIQRATSAALTLLHGSNLGACGHRPRSGGGRRRARVRPDRRPLNGYVGKLKDAEGPVVIVAASYNGRPTDAAAEFVTRVEGLEPGSLDGVQYALLGVGDRNWAAATYQRVHALIDERLTAAGTPSLLGRGAARPRQSRGRCSQSRPGGRHLRGRSAAAEDDGGRSSGRR
ncbi:flavodoxin domain-containing protein [Streptomyces sp. NPDC000941]